MTADVNVYTPFGRHRLYRYQAVCSSCGFKGFTTESRTVAEAEKRRHKCPTPRRQNCCQHHCCHH
ncbi:hypothetical protein ABZY31_17980 [Streptomyces sp. NPDC006529]|uniref:hypothetical protein n=1 Tax=Streptomyces sp. NPDC006529 TaxID=3157177 RepID=UPI00339DD2FA